MKRVLLKISSPFIAVILAIATICSIIVFVIIAFLATPVLWIMGLLYKYQITTRKFPAPVWCWVCGQDGTHIMYINKKVDGLNAIRGVITCKSCYANRVLADMTLDAVNDIYIRADVEECCRMPTPPLEEDSGTKLKRVTVDFIPKTLGAVKESGESDASRLKYGSLN
jgi:hypothetical protein